MQSEERADRHLLRNSAYNLYATIVYFFFQWLLTVIVVRSQGLAVGGEYALAYSLTNLVAFTSRFGVRSVQISDVRHEFSDGVCVRLRLITSAIGVVALLLLLPLLSLGDAVVRLSLILLVFKAAEGFSDLFFGIFQKQNAYQAIAVSSTAKAILPAAVFTVLLLFGCGLRAATGSMTVLFVAVLILFDVPVSKKRGLEMQMGKGDLRKLVTRAFPVFLYTLAQPFIQFFTRFGIEKQLSAELLGAFSSIGMLMVVFTTIGESLFAVLVPEASAAYHAHRKRDLLLSMRRSLMIPIGLFAFAFALAQFFGEALLVLVFSWDILPYTNLLMPVIALSLLMMLTSFLSQMLIAFSKRREMLFSVFLGVIANVLLVFPLIGRLAISGALLSIGLASLCQIMALSCFFFAALRQVGRAETE